MGNGTDILRLALGAGSLALLVYWSVGLWRLARTLRIPTARAGLALAAARPPAASVCVVIPAHNEEAVIGGLVASLRDQDHPSLRVVLCLDRCTDGTAEVVRRAIGDDERFEIIEIDACPADWAGKVHAIWTGVQRSAAASTADLLLFADADTTFSPACVRAAAALLEERGADVLSLLSTLTSDRWFERLVQPAASMELLTQYPLHRANRRTRRRAFANGQFILFRREAYHALGGHAAVRDELLEDLALARLAADRGLHASVHIAAGLLRCRMYHSWAEFRRGWKRIYTEGAKRRPARLRRASVRLRVFGTLLVLAAVAGALFPLLPHARPDGSAGWDWGLAVAALTVWASVMLASYRRQSAPLWAAIGYPIGAWLTAGILSEAARDLERGVPTTWAGRDYTRVRR